MTITFSDIILTVVAISTILSIGYFIFSESKAKKNDETNVDTPENSGQIVGTSRTKVGQQSQQIQAVAQNEPNKRLVVPLEEMEQVFYTREEALLDIDVDMELEYDPTELDDDEEDLLLFEESEPSLATGASFDELAEMSEAIQMHFRDLSQAHIAKAAKTIEKVENTDLFEQLVTHVENGEQQIAAILDWCEEELNETSSPESGNGDMDEFDLGRYL